jgi:hypothetical protein
VTIRRAERTSPKHPAQRAPRETDPGPVLSPLPMLGRWVQSVHGLGRVVSETPGIGSSRTQTIMGTIGDLVDEPVFGASRIGRPDPRRLAHDVADAGKYVCNAQARLADYRQMEALVAPTLASAYCKMAEHRGRSLTPDDCLANATGRLESALQLWLEEAPYATTQVDAKGNLYAPKPCR